MSASTLGSLRKKKTPIWKKDWEACKFQRNRGYMLAHPEYVVPCDMLAAVIKKNHKYIQERVEGFTESMRDRQINNDEGWIEVMATDIAHYTKKSVPAIMRRLFDIRAGRALIVNVSFAESAIDAMGLDMYLDTDIPVLPGNQRHATDLVTVRAEAQGVFLDDEEARRLGKAVHRLSAQFIMYPKHRERLLNLAPFNCLRNWE